MMLSGMLQRSWPVVVHIIGVCPNDQAEHVAAAKNNSRGVALYDTCLIREPLADCQLRILPLCLLLCLLWRTDVLEEANIIAVDLFESVIYVRIKLRLDIIKDKFIIYSN
jgi:hypothetical protein